MIAKINKRKRLSGVLIYNQNKVNEGKAEILSTNLIRTPTDTTTAVESLKNDFKCYAPTDITTKTPIIHISLNPHPEDKLDNSQYVQIADEYMKRLGFAEQPYIIYKHTDIAREHLHIVSLRVDKEGKRIGDSLDYLKSKRITEELEREFNLHPAQGSGQRKTKVELLNKKPDEVRKQIHELTSHLVRKYNFQSIGELRTLLSLYNIGLEEVKGAANDKPYHGLVYCILNDKGEKVTHPIPSSQFGRYLGYKSLSEKMKKNKERIKSKKLREKTKKIIDLTIRNVKSEQEFQNLLKEKNIDVVFRRNEEGRIYGTTFIDHANQTVFNGSRLGKEYSANFFNDRFNQLTTITTPEVANIPMASPITSKETDSIFNATSFNLFDFDNLSLPYIKQAQEEDVSWLYKKKKKKRRRAGRQD